MEQQHLTPLPVDLADAGLPPRESVRPVGMRGDDFAGRFDAETLFFDVRWVSADTIAAFGPPFANNESGLRGMRIYSLPGNGRCKYRLRDALDRHAQAWISAPPGTTHLRIETSRGSTILEVGEPLYEGFRGRRVLATLSQNNNLVWIQDWARYYRDVHAADTVVVYDNASTVYSQQELLAALDDVGGLRRVTVVSWPFKYGPQGINAADGWDSDFAQAGMLEHARWTLLQQAASVVNVDVDELVVSRRSKALFPAIESSHLGTVRFDGRWMPGVTAEFPDAADELIRHRDFTVMDHTVKCLPKWGTVPSRGPSSSQWSVHRVKGWTAARWKTRDFELRHYRHITTGWKDKRDEQDEFLPGRHTVDQSLLTHYSRVHWDS